MKKPPAVSSGGRRLGARICRDCASPASRHAAPLRGAAELASAWHDIRSAVWEAVERTRQATDAVRVSWGGLFAACYVTERV
jgi:hypothetical protein